MPNTVNLTWPPISLKSISSKIGSGATPRGGKNSYKESGISLIRSLNVYDFKFSSEGLAFIDEEQASNLNNVEVKRNDILLNITGASVARCCMVPNYVLPARVNQHVSIIRINTNLTDPHFVLNFLNSPKYKHHLLTLAQGGATREALTKETIENFIILLPPLPTQQKIASILSAYDDLIENNTRRIAILEEMAQMIYREWFVKFRFPGHEKVKRVDSPLGKIPEGWEVKTLGEVTTLITKGTTPTSLGKAFIETGINFVKVEAITSNGVFNEEKFAKIDPDTHALLRRSQLSKGDILFSIAGAIGRAALVTERILPANTNQALAIIRASDILDLVYLYLNVCSGHFQNYSLGRVVQTAQANVSLSVLSAAPIVMPLKELLQSFTNIVSPILDQIDRILRKNINLRQTRDLLLPKLISGELDISDLDIEIPESDEPELQASAGGIK